MLLLSEKPLPRVQDRQPGGQVAFLVASLDRPWDIIYEEITPDHKVGGQRPDRVREHPAGADANHRFSYGQR